MAIPAGLSPSPFQARVPEIVREEDFIDVNGRAVTLFFSDPGDEYRGFRETVGLIDFSMLFKLEVSGPGALNTVNSVFSRNVLGLNPGQIAYGVVVTNDGMMLDDCTVLVYSEDRVRLTGGHPEIENFLRAALTAGQNLVELRDTIATLSVQGPNSRKLLQSISSSDWSDENFPYYTFQLGMDVAGIPAHVNRMGFTAELGFEVMVEVDRALELWDALIGAGGELGVTPCGAAALMMVRVEAGMIMSGLEYDSTVSPFECRMGWSIDLEKGDFLGRDALTGLKGNHQSTIVSIVVDAPADGLDECVLLSENEPVGHVTMAIESPHLDGQTLALARVSRANSGDGIVLQVQSPGGTVLARVVTTPVYDPERLKVRG
jgi:aminomethyltransferase